ADRKRASDLAVALHVARDHEWPLCHHVADDGCALGDHRGRHAQAVGESALRFFGNGHSRLQAHCLDDYNHRMSTRTLVTLFAIPLLALAGCSREKSDWRSAQAADTAESYQQFISEHPDSTLVTRAHERLGQLAEERDWRNAA